MTEQQALALIDEILGEVSPELREELAPLELDRKLEELRLDSFDTIRFLMILELRVDRGFTDEELVAVRSLRDLANLLQVRARSAAGSAAS